MEVSCVCSLGVAAQLRARQGAARDEAKETKKGQNAIEKRKTHSKKRDS
jgi:hypothetical protein